MLHPTSLRPLLVVAVPTAVPWEDTMRTFVPAPRAVQQLRRLHLGELSKGAKRRLSWFTWYEAHGRNASLTCRHFGIGRATFYEWKKRYKPADLRSLEDRPSRPKRCRQKTWTTNEVLSVLALRRKYPFLGKAKLKVFLARQGMQLSASKVGRILAYLKRGRQLVEPLRRISSHPRTPIGATVSGRQGRKNRWS